VIGIAVKDRMKKALVLVLVIGVLASIGCSIVHEHGARVRSSGTFSSLSCMSYVLLPAENDGADTAEFRELAGYVKRALARLNFSEARGPDVADLVIFLSYGLGNPPPSSGLAAVHPGIGYRFILASYTLSTTASRPSPLLMPVRTVYRRYLIVKEGDAVEEILSTADEKGCDAIVLGTHGKGWPKQTLPGSVARSVLERTRKPTFLIPLPSEKVGIDWRAL